MKPPALDHPLFRAAARPAARSLAIPLAIFLAVGCNRTSPLVGKWNGNIGNQQQQIDFNENKTFTATAKVPNLPGASLVMTGTWNLEGEDFTRTVTKVDTPGLDPTMKPLVDKLFANSLNQPVKGKIKIEGDTATINSPNAAPITLTRIKTGE